MKARALLAGLPLIASLVGCAPSAIVAPLRYEPVAPAEDQAFRASPPEAPAAAAPPELARWFQTTLPNGLRVALLPRHGLPVVAVSLVADRGAADVGAEIDATSLLARVLAASTDTKTTAEVGAAWARLGAACTASVQPDATSLTARLAAVDLEEGIGLIAASAKTGAVAERDLASARTSWLRDFKATGGNPALMAERNLLAAVFGPAHGYGFHKPSEDHTWAINGARIGSLRSELFRPSHATLVVVGDATPEEVTRIAARWLGGWVGAPAAPRPVRQAALPPGPRVVVASAGYLAHARGTVAVRLPRIAEDDLAAVDVLARMLGGLSSPLFHEVREDQGAAYAFGASVMRLREATLVSVNALLEPTQAANALARMVAAIRAVRATPPSAEAVELARGSAVGAYRTLLANDAGIAALASSAVARGLPLESVGAYPARLAAVTPADVARVASRYFGDDALHVVVVGDPRVIGDLSGLGLGPAVRRDAFAEPLP